MLKSVYVFSFLSVLGMSLPAVAAAPAAGAGPGRRGRFQDGLGVGGQALGDADGPGIAVHLQKVVDVVKVALRYSDDLLGKAGNQHTENPPSQK